jgi:protein TonB
VRRGRAVYPPEALRKGETGTVLLELFISETGSVDRVSIVRSSGVPTLDAAAAAAEKRSRFRPPTVDGRPVKSKARVPYTFELR